MYKWITSQAYEDDCYVLLFDSEGMIPRLIKTERPDWIDILESCSDYGYEKFVGIVYCYTENEFEDFLRDHKYEAFIDFVE